MRSGHNVLSSAKHNLPIYSCNRRLSVLTVNRFVLTVYVLVWSPQIAFNGKNVFAERLLSKTSKILLFISCV